MQSVVNLYPNDSKQEMCVNLIHIKIDIVLIDWYTILNSRIQVDTRSNQSVKNMYINKYLY